MLWQIKLRVQVSHLSPFLKTPFMNISGMHGPGYERQDIYKKTQFKFLGVDNIHVIRESHRKLCEQCHPFNINEGEDQVRRTIYWNAILTPNGSFAPKSAWFSALTSWMGHLYTLLRGAVRVVATVHDLGSSAVVHCSDGWDRTPQVRSLILIHLII